MLSRGAVWLSFALTGTALALSATGTSNARPFLARLVAVAAAGAWLVLGLALLARGLAAGHWPLTNRYEFALWVCWLALSLTLWLGIRGGQAGSAWLALLGIVAVALVYALLQPASDQALWPLPPALQSAWLPVHVLASVVGYGGCLVAGGLASAMLLNHRQAEGPGARAMAQSGSLMERSLALAFPWLTLSLLAGAAWAHDAWGRYWGWDPKESWALVTWLWYLLLLHLRSNANWQGQRRAVMVIVGAGFVAFTVAGLPWLVRAIRLESLHGF